MKPQNIGMPYDLYEESIPSSLESDPLDIKVQEYNYGESCGDKKRRVYMHMECASFNHVKFVEENPICVYRIGFGTPAACSKHYVKHLREQIRILRQGHDEL